jgi:hypothetical protein
MNKELDRVLLAFQLSQRQHKSEPDQPTTFFDHQANELSEAGGRFAALGKPRLTGRDPAPEHDSHLNQFIDGPEPPLGYSVDDLPDEIQASLPQPSVPPLSDGETGASDPDPDPDGGRTFSNRRGQVNVA